jgi:hypothetical protein
VLPPIFLPFFRDSAITLWNYANAKCNIEIEQLIVEGGLEKILIKGDICNCLLNEIKVFSSCDQNNLNNLSNGELSIKNDNIKLKLGKGTLFFQDEVKDILKIMNSVKDQLLYSFGRGFLVLRSRSSYKIIPTKGMFYLSIEGWSHGLIIENGAKLGQIMNDVFLLTSEQRRHRKISQREFTNVFLLTSELVFDKSIISEFFTSEFDSLKETIRKVIKTFKGDLKESPIIQDILYDRILLEVVNKSLSSSISYALNWPSLRVYVNTKTSLMLMDFPSTVFDIAKVTVLESAEELGMRPRELIYKITKILDKGIGNNSKVTNDMYILANSILQGRPDLDLLYRVWRAEEIESRS